MTTNNAINTAMPLTVPDGGTGFSSTTAYGILLGGNTSTSVINNGGTGSIYQLFVSSGSSAPGFWTSVLQNLTGLGIGATGGLAMGTGFGAPDNNTIISTNTNGNISLDPNGTGWVNININSAKTGIQFNNQIQTRLITYYETANNAHQIYSTGVNAGQLRYQVDSTTSDHVFYAGASSSSSNELFRVKGNGDIIVSSGTLWPSRLPSGWMYMEGNGSATTITTANTFVKAAGTTTSGSLNNFTMPANNKLLYSGTPTITANVEVTASVSQNQTASIVTIAIFKNGTRVTGTNSAASFSGSGNYLNLCTNTAVSLATNDYIEVFMTGSINGQTATTANLQVYVSTT